MLHVGIDGHQKSSVVNVFDPKTGVHRVTTVATTAAGLRAALEPLGGDCTVVFEVGPMAQWMAQQIRPLAARLQVANASRIPWLFRDGRKNDRLDAKKLAILSHLDQVPTVHLPPPEVSAWRGLINERRQLVTKRARAKLQTRAIMRANGLICPCKSLWTRGGMIWLAGLSLEAVVRGRIDRLVAELNFLGEQLKQLERELDTRSATQPAVALLRTIPGVGPRTAEALIAYADDIGRFSNRKQFTSYFGLTPTEDSSADRVRRGHISKRGPSVVRWVLVEAAQTAIRRCPALREFARRVARGRKDRWKKAIVATARKLASIAFGMLRSGKPFDISRLTPAA